MRSSNSSRRVITAAFVTYLLTILTCVPFTSSAHLPAIRPSRMQQPAPQYRAGELLVRFRAGVSRHDQEAIIARHGAQRKNDLRGESGIGKLTVTSRDVSTVAVEMLLDPQVEFAEPNFVIVKDDVVPNDAHFNDCFLTFTQTRKSN